MGKWVKGLVLGRAGLCLTLGWVAACGDDSGAKPVQDDTPDAAPRQHEEDAGGHGGNASEADDAAVDDDTAVDEDAAADDEPQDTGEMDAGSRASCEPAAERDCTGADNCAGKEMCSAAGEWGACECTASVCEPDTFRCVSDLLQKCRADGSAYDDELTCEDGKACDAEQGACVDPPACEAGAYRCVGQLLQVCRADGAAWDDAETCGGEQVCSEELGECGPAPKCATDEYRCAGQLLQQCRSDRSGFDDVTTCTQEQTCNDATGMCDDVTMICTPNAYRCDKQTLERCNAAGSAWTVSNVCTASETCNASSGACDSVVSCEPETARCVGDVLGICNAEGNGWEDENCTADTACNLEASDCVTLSLSPVDGWVSRFENGVGIQGAWFTFSGGFNTISDWSFAGGDACMSGTSAVGSSNGDRPTGAFQLCLTDEEQANADTEYTIGSCPFGDLGSIKGFSFTLTGEVPFGTRMQFIEQNGLAEGAFVPVSSGFNQVLIADAENLQDESADLAKIKQVVFQIPTADFDDIDFDFCVSDLTVVR